MASFRFKPGVDEKEQLALRNFIRSAKPYVEGSEGKKLITDAEELKKLYRSLALRYHPDRSPPEKKEENTAIFQAISPGYKVLTDKYKRGDKIAWPIEEASTEADSKAARAAAAKATAARSESDAEAEAEAEAEAQRQRAERRAVRLPPTLNRMASVAVAGTDRNPQDLILGVAVVHLLVLEESGSVSALHVGLYVSGMLIPGRSVIIARGSMTNEAFKEAVKFSRKSILSGVALEMVTVKWHEMPVFMLGVRDGKVTIEREMWASDVRNLIYAAREEEQRPDPIVRGEVPPDIYGILVDLLMNPRLFGARQAGVLIFVSPSSKADPEWMPRVLAANARTRPDRKMSEAEITRIARTGADDFLADPLTFSDISGAVSHVLALLHAQEKSLDDVSVVVYQNGKAHLLSV